MDTFRIVASMPILKNREKNVKGTAAIRMSDDGKFIYISTRFKDVLSVVDSESFELVEVKDCGGKHPRDFIVIGDHLLCANMESDSIVSFGIKKGTLSSVSSELKVPEAIALCL